MTSNATSTKQGELKPTWSQKFTDFVITLASGQELKCHRQNLAENSSFFDTMLNGGMSEAKTNSMKMEHVDEETVFHFLEYIYASDLTSVQAQLQASAGPNQYIYKRNFKKEKLTLELFKMAHMYRVDDLITDCAHHLKTTVTDGNVMTLWVEAERCGNDILTSAVVAHLVKRTSGRKLSEIPGYDEVIGSQEKPIKELLEALANENMRHQTKISMLEEQLKRLQNQQEKVGKYEAKSIEDEMFDITVEWQVEWYYDGGVVNKLVQKSRNVVVRPSEVIKKALSRLREIKSCHLYLEDYHIKFKGDYLDRTRTFEHYKITRDCQDVREKGHVVLKLECKLNVTIY